MILSLKSQFQDELFKNYVSLKNDPEFLVWLPLLFTNLVTASDIKNSILYFIWNETFS